MLITFDKAQVGETYYLDSDGEYSKFKILSKFIDSVNIETSLDKDGPCTKVSNLCASVWNLFGVYKITDNIPSYSVLEDWFDVCVYRRKPKSLARKILAIFSEEVLKPEKKFVKIVEHAKRNMR